VKPKVKRKRHFWAGAALIPACAILMFAVTLLSPIRASAAALLRLGDQGDAVVRLQESLADLGYSPGPIDGDFGRVTVSAVRRFQAASGLDPDGICGPLTWAAIERSGAGASRGWTVLRAGILAGKTVAVDPGHGGNEPGAISAWGDKEKDFTLGIALKVKGYLESLGAKVTMTRYGDYPPGSDWGREVDELLARASLANTNRADVFVSIHVNSYAQDAGVCGAMGFYRAGSPDSLELARSVARAVSRTTRLSLIDVQAGPYYVLNHTYMPAALVEVGFMTNRGDVSLLRQDSFRDAAARGIVAGIVDYLGH
jgi:N-acetylmuramoyl-L-alanine amidase